VAATVDNPKQKQALIAALEAEIARREQAAPQTQLNDFTTPVEQHANMPWATRAMRGLGSGLLSAGIKAGEIAQKPGIKQALWALDLPMKPIRAGLEKIHEKAIEPNRARTEEEAAAFVKDPGVGAAAPEAFAPLPGKNSFVMPVEAALTPGAYGLVSKGLRGVGILPKAKVPPSPTGGTAGGKTAADMEEAINKATAAEMGGEAGAAPFSVVARGENLPPLRTPSFLNRGLEVRRPDVPTRTVKSPVPVPRTGGPFGPLSDAEWAERAAGGYGFAPPSKAQLKRAKELYPTPQEAAKSVAQKMGRGDASVNKILQQINDIGIQGEATQAPFKFPGHDPFLELMRKMGGG